MYCCLSGMPASGKFSNSHCQRSANYSIRRLKICSNFRSKSTKEKLEENYSPFNIFDLNLIDGFKVIST